MNLAIVGNAPAQKDFSAEIDAADIVVRLNHCAELGGRYGRRIDALAITPTTAWLLHPRRERSCAACREARAKIYVTKNFILMRTREFQEGFAGCECVKLPVARERVNWTTGTLALAAFAEMYPQARIRLYGFSETAETFRGYLLREGPWHLRAAADELAFREKFMRAEQLREVKA